MYTNNNIKKTITITLAILSGNAYSDELKEREQAASRVAGELIQQLGAKLKAEMQSGGPASAIKVCRETAPAIATRLSLENGWRVTRVSSKPRNSLLGMPDEWEATTLAEFERRVSQGESYQDMSSSNFVLENGKSYFRYMKPIPTQAICLNCHGSDEQISPAVKAELEKLYPHDRATGYAVGNLRGAVSIKQPVDTLVSESSTQWP